MNNLPHCSKCDVAIVFCLTKSGKHIPVNFSSFCESEKESAVNGVSIPFVYGRHVSHFATCPFAKDFRKKKVVNE